MSQPEATETVSLSNPYPVPKGVAKVSTYVILQSLCIYTFSTNVTWDNWKGVTCATVLGWILSDLVAGIVHFGLDNYKALDPLARIVLGSGFVDQYQSHHARPLDLATQGFWATNSDGLFATSMLLMLVYARAITSWDLQDEFYLSLLWFFIVYCIFTAFSNQFHKWSHQPHPNFVVKTLQNWGIIISKKEHHRHHTNNKVAYCVTTGIWNSLLEKINFWSIFPTLDSEKTD